MKKFAETLEEHGLDLVRANTSVLQVNVGLLCNQVCKHCHLDAGPQRQEIMTADTMGDIGEFARNHPFDIFDITGGAPELNPDIKKLVRLAAETVPTVMFRANLTALLEKANDLLDFLKDHKVQIVASYPSINQSQTDAQRGRGVFDQSLKALQMLNEAGYGQPGSGLGLDLVSNPAGAFLPSDQTQLAQRFRKVLKDRWNIEFNNLFAIANMPLGRFRAWLERSGNLESYTAKLTDLFNPEAINGLMCRNTLSVAWDGYMFDCDFNQAAGLPLGGKSIHISQMQHVPEPESRIAVSDHCYTCTAGAGFT